MQCCIYIHISIHTVPHIHVQVGRVLLKFLKTVLYTYIRFWNKQCYSFTLKRKTKILAIINNQNNWISQAIKKQINNFLKKLLVLLSERTFPLLSWFTVIPELVLWIFCMSHVLGETFLLLQPSSLKAFLTDSDWFPISLWILLFPPTQEATFFIRTCVSSLQGGLLGVPGTTSCI